eukprot:comp22201_c0_seq1/m.32648 comp22201_c0_seq1/g.32648  ORF comp22201_c0_seq1/g.32648 comp22201_c0_seq1/m.32648 type:complete len:205 (-) comp22201_c0_seq1:263-877(-)
MVDKEEDGKNALVKAGFDDPAIMSTKHPLQNKWTLWYDNPNRKTNSQSWSLYLKKVTDFDTVEDFWAVWKSIVPALKLVAGSNYHLFKYGIQPMWEDPANEAGGKWQIISHRNQREEKLEGFWFNTALAVVGETMDDDGQVTGCVVSIRRVQDKLAVWTRYADRAHEATIRRIGQRFRSACNYDGMIGFQAHKDTSSFKSAYEQ